MSVTIQFKRQIKR